MSTQPEDASLDVLREKLLAEPEAILMERLGEVLKDKGRMIDAIFTYGTEQDLDAIAEELFGIPRMQRKKLTRQLEASICERVGSQRLED